MGGEDREYLLFAVVFGCVCRGRAPCSALLGPLACLAVKLAPSPSPSYHGTRTGERVLASIMSLVFWKRVVKLFSPPKVQDAAEKRKSPSLTPNEPGNQPDALSGESSSAPNTPPANNNDSEIHLDDYQPDDSDTSSVASDTETADTFNDSGSYTSNVVTVSKPKKKKKSKSGSFGRNSGISKHHIKKIREKYLNENTSPNTNSPNNTSTNNTNTSNNNNNNSSSDSSSSEASSDASPPQPPPAQRPKKRRSPSRSVSTVI